MPCRVGIVERFDDSIALYKRVIRQHLKAGAQVAQLEAGTEAAGGFDLSAHGGDLFTDLSTSEWTTIPARPETHERRSLSHD